MKTLILLIIIGACSYEIGYQRGLDEERSHQQQAVAAEVAKGTPPPTWMWNAKNSLDETPVPKHGRR